jgi:hypothetical protein
MGITDQYLPHLWIQDNNTKQDFKHEFQSTLKWKEVEITISVGAA